MTTARRLISTPRQRAWVRQAKLRDAQVLARFGARRGAALSIQRVYGILLPRRR